MDKTIRLNIPDSLDIRREREISFRAFFQSMLNRLLAGELRYGEIHKKKKYLTRLLKETQAYKKTGNAEQLFNIANYCILEFIAPEHPKHHMDTTVESVARE